MQIKSRTDQFEETLIALLLGLMTLITFANVVVRYVFASSWFSPVTDFLNLPTNVLWGLEATVFLFAWLVLIGASYCVKVTAHLGVDIILNLGNAKIRRMLALLAVLSCLIFSLLLLKGAWDYWAPFVNLPPTSGQWFPTGFKEQFAAQGFYSVESIPMPDFLQPLLMPLNFDERYDYLPKFIPYAALPIGISLLLFRFVQAGILVIKGDKDMIIASHEAEDMVDEAASNADKD